MYGGYLSGDGSTYPKQPYFPGSKSPPIPWSLVQKSLCSAAGLQMSFPFLSGVQICPPLLDFVPVGGRRKALSAPLSSAANRSCSLAIRALAAEASAGVGPASFLST